MGAELDPERRQKALEALAAGASKAEAARVSGYTTMHIFRLVKDERFAADVERLRAKVAATVPANGDEKLALDRLRTIIGDDGQEAKDHIAASRAILAHAALKKARAVAVAPPAPPLKILPADGGKQAADEWLKGQA